MNDDALGRIAAEVGPRRVVVVSDRYPPDVGGGAEVSLHLLMREAPLREQAVVVTFDKSLDRPLRRRTDGVDVVALPANAAWPLHRMSQMQVERLKRRPCGLKWLAFLREAIAGLVRAPAVQGPAIALRLLGAPPGGVRMEHAVGPEGRQTAGLRQLLEAIRPELVHADNAAAIMTAAEALGGRGTPLVALVRDHRFTSSRFDQGSGPEEPGLKGRLAALCAQQALAYRQRRLRRADVVIATSANLAGSLSDAVAAERLRRVPLVPVALPAPSEARGEGFSILVVGSLADNKGQARLVEAWPDVVAAIPNARLTLAGEGRARAEIEAVVARLGAEGRVRLVGHVGPEALAELYRDCDVVALPTLWSEPFGRGPLEAGAAGRPVVAYAVGGLVETVVDGVTGRLAPLGDLRAFVGALAELAADRATRVRMGEAGRARVAEAHAPARLAGLLADTWNEALAARSAPRAAESR